MRKDNKVDLYKKNVLSEMEDLRLLGPQLQQNSHSRGINWIPWMLKFKADQASGYYGNRE